MIVAGVTAVLMGMLAQPAPQPVDDGIPQYVVESAEAYGTEYGIAPELLEAIAYTESRYQPDADNGSCKGLMQISERWHADRMQELGITDIYNADQNMHLAADYLADLFEDYEDTGLVLMKYNGASQSKIDRYTQTGEMSDYAEDVLELSEELERMHNK